jgi:hypothetical protein
MSQQTQIRLTPQQMIQVCFQVLGDMKKHFENPLPNDNIAPDTLRSIVHSQNLLGVFLVRLQTEARQRSRDSMTTPASSDASTAV